MTAGTADGLPAQPGRNGAAEAPGPDARHEAATRVVYDHSASQFVQGVGTEVSPSFEAALDRAVLAAFAEQLTGLGAGAVLDAGCGVGRGAAFLASHGVEVSGVDISPRMVLDTTGFCHRCARIRTRLHADSRWTTTA